MRTRLLVAVIVVLIGALAYVAWRQNTTPAVPESETTGGAPGASGTPGDIAGGMAEAPAQDPGVTWETPKRWVEELAGGMRLATYVIPAPAAGGEGAKCAVYYFGPGQGGGTEANIERWIGEFENPGKPAQRTSEVRGMKVSQVEVAGTYRAHAGMGEGAQEAAPGWSLLGAIVEGPSGALFFKLTGPSTTVAPAKKEFEAMLASLKAK